MKRKDYEEYYREIAEVKEIVKKRLGLGDTEITQMCIDFLGETIFNASTVEEFSGCMGGDIKVKNGHVIHYNYSLGEMGKEANERLYKLANEHVNLNKEFIKRNN